jgi:two-component system, NtrC family, response regulator GlrR
VLHGSVLEAGDTFEQPGGAATLVRRVRAVVVEGGDAGATAESEVDRLSIGTHPSNALVVGDRTVSRFHCELRVDRSGVRVRDLESTNGTIVDGLRVVDCWAKDGSILALGDTRVRLELAGERMNRLPLASSNRFGALAGESAVMRATFALLERAAPASATILLEGETGTGKGAAARALHDEGPRRAKPFVVIDCSAIPENLLESELFGHEKGAFTGADARRIGAFEGADGGTIFLDEIGELPLALQPKLLRVLEDRELRRVGATTALPVDVRVIAATNRDLRAEVNAGRFRSDLYFRLAVVRIPLPPLRQRPDDLPALVTALLDRLGADDEQAAPLTTPDALAKMRAHAWPGNVRELRNHLERCLVFQDAVPISDELDGESSPPPGRVDATIPFTVAREQANSAFEKAYVQALLRSHGGRMGKAAAAAGIGRVYLYKLAKKHGLK